MSFLGLPWAIGPIPIVATMWAAYVCSTAIAKKGGMSGEVFFAALLLPTGLIATACQLFLSDLNFIMLLISIQILSSVCFFALTGASKGPLLGERDKSKSHESAYTSPIYVISFAIICVAFNYLISMDSANNRCTIAKCFILELFFGGKEHVFSRLYLYGSLGSIILIGFCSSFFRSFLSRKIQPR
jgi:hypothetical protein